ncbi:J domain-containing protein [Solimicrobium silvestre]|nr:DnaJ domain-containing protein [Solimicrobium silvestre]
MNINKDLYAVLGLASTALPDEIKKAFRLKASEFHPDKNTSELAPSKFREVREAYEVLSDPVTRAVYDDNRRRNLLESPLETASEIWSTYVSGVLH